MRFLLEEQILRRSSLIMMLTVSVLSVVVKISFSECGIEDAGVIAPG